MTFFTASAWGHISAIVRQDLRMPSMRAALGRAGQSPGPGLVGLRKHTAFV